MDENNKSTKELIKMVIEGDDGSLWGRVEYDDNLIVEEAKTVEELQQNFKKLLFDFHNLNPDSYEFQIEYDLTAFFYEFDFLKVTKIAELSGLNGSLVRQYATGKKFPSAKQAEKIENAIKRLALQLSDIHIFVH